jgi:hypothetical protein
MSACVEQLAPVRRSVTVAEVLADLSTAPRRAPFAPEVLELCAALARRLAPHARTHPELGALAFWLRPASLRRLAPADGEATGDVRRVARGLAFHVPPSNVETMAMYSLVLSLLSGNANVVRVSPTRGPVAEILWDALSAALAEPAFAQLRAGVAIVAYGHEPEPTAELSAACDVRMVWGGDATVTTIRRAPLAPHVRDIAFGDRFSLAALDAAAWLATDDAQRTGLAQRLFADVFFFDQQGCSSPRLVVWCGAAANADAASDDLMARLQAEVERRGYVLPTAAVTGKLTAVAGAAIDLPVRAVRRISNELHVVSLDALEELPREVSAPGLLLEATLPALSDLGPLLERRDQTLVVHGFAPPAIDALLDAAAGRGLDRIVPLGAALRFSHRWDGMDLLDELTRAVVVEVAA